MSHVADVAGRINDVSTSIVSETSNVKSGQIVQSSVASGSIDDCKLEEDCIASEANINLTGQPMPHVLQSRHIENDIYSCAPGENNTSHYMLMDSEFEVLAFPNLFLYGVGGYSTCGHRQTKLSMHKYFQQHLLNVGGHFANNIEYLFHAQYVT